MKTTVKLWIGIGMLLLLSPLGLILPAYFKAGDAWGEWGTDSIKGLAGYIPQGLAGLSSLWRAPMPDYAIKGWEDKGLARMSLGYIASAMLGIALVAAAALLLGRLLTRKGGRKY